MSDTAQYSTPDTVQWMELYPCRVVSRSWVSGARPVGHAQRLITCKRR
jgi:hypothetical protein